MAAAVFMVSLLSAGAAQGAFTITKTVDISDPNPGDYVVFTINLGNTPRSDLSGATLTDDMSIFNGDGKDVTYTYDRVGEGGGGNPPIVSVGPDEWQGSFKGFTGSRNPRNYTVREIKIRARIPERLAGQDITNVATISKPGVTTKSASVTVQVRSVTPADAPQVFTPYAKPVPALYENRVEPNVLLLLDTSGSMTYESDSEDSTYGDGSKPVVDGFTSRQYYYGQDTDSTNNDPKGPSNYHPNLKYVPQAEIELLDSQRGSQAKTWLGGPHPNDDPPEGYSHYKYPNDSRLYKMKLVLDKILSDPQLTSGLRIALATYHQKESAGGTDADWYQFPLRSSRPPYNYSNETQKLHYAKTGDPKALLRVPFGSADDPSHLSSILKWFDGVEESGNPELRAAGWTPLAASIYGFKYSYPQKWDSTQDSAVKYFKANGGVQWRCQYNWLIVLTDGADTENSDPVEAVRKLYHENITASEDRQRGLPVRTLVIGLIDPEKMTGLADTLESMADLGWDGQVGEADPEDPGPGAFFSTDIESLIYTFRRIFEIIQASRTTGGAPMVSPARTEAGDSSIYVASFLPQNSAQWKGHLFQYTVGEGGAFDEDANWDASSTLQGQGPGVRNIVTVDWAGSMPSTKAEGLGAGTNLVGFDGSASLMDEVTGSGEYSLSSDFLALFISWARGFDIWNENPASTAGHRYMFTDIYHGGVTEVGPPRANYPSQAYADFVEAHKERDKTLYLQSNAGLLHAIDPDNNGAEKWAFIPPNVLGNGRLLGLKGQFSNDGKVQVLNSTSSIPRYLLDGPLVAEDVLMGGEWRTILVGLLGYGGQGLYALDVTEPEEPIFLWAVENNIVTPDGSSALGADSRKIHYWKKSRSLQADYAIRTHAEVGEELDYRDLYRTLSTPIVANTAGVVDGGQGLWEDRWVAVMGNGHPGNFGGNPGGGAVYMIDVQSGEVLRKLTARDSGGANVLKPVCSPVTGFGRSMAARLLDHLYAGDIGGDVYSWESGRDNWSTALKIFQAPADEAGITYRMDVGMLGGQPWLFYQTGDIENLNYSSSGYRLYALNTSRASDQSPLTIEDLEGLTPAHGTASNTNGWHLDFPTNPLEIPSTPVTFYNGYLLFATFSGDLDDPCAIGSSRFYAVNALTGGGAWGGGNKFVQLEGIQVAGITVFDDKVYLGVVGSASSGDLKSALGESARLSGNLLSFDLPDEIPSGGDAGSGAVPGLIFWREWRTK
ncbi:MAG: PilC/PilY family type IV pilus protein [Thermovirgaceae bacterium]|nr:PilC/PilY family type IV pilus protein [Synergistales bacterium]